MAAGSVQRSFAKVCVAVRPTCLRSLAARVEEILTVDGSQRAGVTDSTVIPETVQTGYDRIDNPQSSSICNPRSEGLRSEAISQGARTLQRDRANAIRSVGGLLRGGPPPRGIKFMSAVASEHDGILVEEEKPSGEEPSVEEEGPEQNSLYTSAEGPAEFTAADLNRYYTISSEDAAVYFGEGLPPSLMKEFEETRERSFLIRARVLELFDRFKRCQVDTLQASEEGGRVRSPASKHKPQCLLDGFIKSGKSAALAMLVHWARIQGWLVFYVPCARDWTSGGMYYKNEHTGLYDTPVQAKTILEGFLKSHGSLLATIPCRVLKPLQLGEGAGVGKLRGSQELSLPEGSTLKDLVEKGIAVSQVAVSVVVRIREELSRVKEAPVLICVDEYNSWFTFSHFHESTGTRSRRPIHARELSMVNAFRNMEGPLMMATAFSSSLAVGKLPVQLPGVPKNVRFPIQRYNLEEATAAMMYYHSRKITSKEPSKEDIKKLFYLTNGNGEEMRTLARFLG
ncbi:hypothetical protein R1sor_019764 [Riccia sorocarpa]|uniref:Small ribosomal subunit protein mS29 n=1 Tax=Riccia sorocarpa TaxID=122646 RepID=A0ABD3IHT2_9MARC